MNSTHPRETHIEAMAQEEFDLAIVGGGITGAGIARDAASRGLKVALVEAQDFASGTSSRSSKLIHGGVRYLENFEFSLVFEALSERALLFKLAPHLVHPLRFLIPVYSHSRVGLWKMRLGMWLYDLLALFETPQMHSSLSATEVREKIVGIESRDLLGAVEYSDAYTDDDRLVIETLRDAQRLGAKIANYCKVTSCQKQAEKITSLQVEDSLGERSFQLKAKQFVSGVGPWTDLFGTKVDSGWKPRLRPTKGVHLVFSRKRIPIETAVVMAVEKRIIFVIPRHEMVIVGTTDTDFKGDPAKVSTQVDDVSYILNALDQYFPSLRVGHQDIVSSYAGVRPLVNDGSESEGKTSREHSIFDHGPNLTFVAGGKYTTYRLISEQSVDFVLNKMDFDEAMQFGPSQTKKALNPLITPATYERAKSQVDHWSQSFGLNRDVVEHLAYRYGEEATVLLEMMGQESKSLSTNESLWRAEARFAIRHTLCMSLKDFYWRRSPLFLAAKNHGLNYLKTLIEVFQEELGWSQDISQREEEELLTSMQKELSWKAETEKLL